VKLAFSYFTVYFLTTVRNIPAFFFTLVFPVIMLLLFVNKGVGENIFISVIVFFNYSVQTVTFMLLGMGVTQEKNSLWSKYLRTLPVSQTPMIMGRIFHTLTLSCLNLFHLTLVTLFLLKIPLSGDQVFYFVSIALLGGIPMALFGMSLGSLVGPDSARSLFTLLNLLLLFGAFALPQHKTSFGVSLSDFVPTYQWMRLSYSYIDKSINPIVPLLWLAAYGGFFVLCYFIVQWWHTRQLKTFR
jgi:ABC-2 type transport system permease protein